MFDETGAMLSAMVANGLGDATGRPLVGQPFWIVETIGVTDTVRFGGFLSEVVEQAEPSSTALNWFCTATSWGGVCDRRVITSSYPTGTIAQNVAFDIIDQAMPLEGIQKHPYVGLLELLPAPLNFAPSTVTDAFNQLRNFTGEHWWIDEQKYLHFVLIGSGPNSGITISDTSMNWLSGTMKVTRTSEQFRNQQYEKTSSPVGTESRTESFVGTGDLYTGWAFMVKFGITSAPTITVDGVSQPVFQLSVDDPGQAGWYWIDGGPVVWQGQQIPPAAGSVINVTYDGLSISYVVDDNTSSQADRAAIEGGSGIWANIDQTANLQTADVAHSYGQGLLSSFAQIPVVVEFDTFVEGFDTQIGSYVTFSLALHNLSGTFTITDVSATEVPGLVAPSPASGGTMKYTVKLTNQPTIGNNITFFTNVVASIRNAADLASQASAAIQLSTAAPAQTSLPIIREIPSGTMNGSNTVFTTTKAPSPPWAFWLFLNGVMQNPFGTGSPVSGGDYTLSGNTITYAVAPKSTDNHFVIYFMGMTAGAPSSVPIPTVIGTGYVSGSFGAPGSIDSNWVLQTSADATYPGPDLFIAANRPSNWVANLSDAQWLSPENNPASVDNTVGTYTYRLSFSLSGFDPTSIVITGKFAADNSAAIKVNGTTVVPNTGALNVLTDFTLNTGFTSGTNTIDFVVTNVASPSPDPTGLLVEIISALGRKA